MQERRLWAQFVSQGDKHHPTAMLPAVVDDVSLAEAGTQVEQDDRSVSSPHERLGDDLRPDPVIVPEVQATL